MTPYKDGAAQLPHEGLRDEAEGWAAQGNSVECGEAIMLPDDGSGTMYGFYDSTQGKGMVAWGMSESVELSDWIDAATLEEVFKSYLAGTS